jgi:hypothetical protein
MFNSQYSIFGSVNFKSGQCSTKRTKYHNEHNVVSLVLLRALCAPLLCPKIDHYPIFDLTVYPENYPYIYYLKILPSQITV